MWKNKSSVSIVWKTAVGACLRTFELTVFCVSHASGIHDRCSGRVYATIPETSRLGAVVLLLMPPPPPDKP